MDIKKRILTFVMILIAICILLISIPHLIPPSSIESSFNGNVESFDLVGEDSVVQFKAKNIVLITNDVVFYDIKNIDIENNKERSVINNISSLQIGYKKGRLQLSNIDLIIFLNNMRMKNFNYVELYGNLNTNFSNYVFFTDHAGFSIDKSDIEYIIIGNENFTEFDQIHFLIDNTSSIQFLSETIELTADGITDFKVTSDISGLFIIEGQGSLRLNNHKFDLQKNDFCYISFAEKSNSFDTDYARKDSNVRFYGDVRVAKINSKNVIESDFVYWLKKQPETFNAFFGAINAFSVIILVILTGWYAYSTKSMLIEQRLTLDEQRKGRKIDGIEKKLENVYSPIEEAVTEFKLELEQLLILNRENPTLPNEVRDIFRKMAENMLTVKKNYGHLIDSDTIFSFQDVWNIYLHLDKTTQREQTDILKSLINTFHAHITNKIYEYNKQLKELQ